MKREEIEQLLAGYASSQMSASDKERLNDLFEKDAALKKEADEMSEMWSHFDQAEATVSVSEKMNAALYQMLQMEKASLHNDNGRVVSIKRTWLNMAAVILVFIVAFACGRFSITPQTVFKYKTVYVKQPVNIPTEIAKPITIKPAAGLAQQNTRKKPGTEVNTALAQQLRSVYASERIGAVMKLTNKPNLDNDDLQSLALALNEDPNSNVRLTILNALRPVSGQSRVQQVLITALSRQDDIMVQTSIVDLLIGVKSKKAIPQMIALLDDKHTDIATQNEIKAGIESLLN